MWTWLSEEKNQRVLAFIGAGVAGLVVLLVQLGIVDTKDKAPPPTTPAAATAVSVPSAASAAPATSVTQPTPAGQQASAGDGSTVVQIQGNGNRTNIKR